MNGGTGNLRNTFSSFISLARQNIIIWIILAILILVTFSTQYYGTTDIPDYSDVAKFFADNQSAKIRGSHSYLYGFVHAPFVKLTQSFLFFKVTSIVSLILIILSVYHISGRSKKAFLLILFSPIVWYMAPWISPIQTASLFLLWAFYFIKKYDEEGALRDLIYSGIFIGLGWALWGTILFFGAFLTISFMFNKKLSHLIILIVSILIGLAPRLFLDQYLFGFPFYTTMKNFFGIIASVLFLNNGTSHSSGIASSIFLIVLILIIIPIYYWKLYSKELFKRNLKSNIFLALSILLIFTNPQIRYTLAITPIAIVLISKHLSFSQFRKQVIFSLILSLVFFAPYLVQVKYAINQSEYYEITNVATNIGNLSLSRYSESDILAEDLLEISNDYPNQVFLVVGHQDYYQKLAHLYWGNKVEEFVSEQDYTFWLKNESSLFEKELTFIPRIRDRRSIWIAGGISKNPNDDTNYTKIQYAISLDDTLPEGFKEVKKYKILKAFEKIQ